MNFSEVRFVSFMGLGVIVERLRKVRALGGDIKLSGLNTFTQHLMRVLGLGPLFQVYEGETQAVRAFQEAA
jgi:anti-anti-sigma factor